LSQINIFTVQIHAASQQSRLVNFPWAICTSRQVAQESGNASRNAALQHTSPLARHGRALL
jgi:hypothetical protein